jgi:hypothetical protein
MSFFRRNFSGLKSINLGPDITISVLDNNGGTGGVISANAAYRINANAGTYSRVQTVTDPNSTTTVTYDWLRGQGGSLGGLFFVRATSISGDVPVGTLNTWLQTNANRTWYVTAGEDLALEGILLIEISSSSSASGIVDSHRVTLSATGGVP